MPIDRARRDELKNAILLWMNGGMADRDFSARLRDMMRRRESGKAGGRLGDELIEQVHHECLLLLKNWDGDRLIIPPGLWESFRARIALLQSDIDPTHSREVDPKSSFKIALFVAWVGVASAITIACVARWGQVGLLAWGTGLLPFIGLWLVGQRSFPPGPNYLDAPQREEFQRLLKNVLIPPYPAEKFHRSRRYRWEKFKEHTITAAVAIPAAALIIPWLLAIWPWLVASNVDFRRPAGPSSTRGA